MKTEQAVFIRTFKTLRADGHAVRTIYSLCQQGVVQVDRFFISPILNEGCVEIRRFRGMVYQSERMVFKLQSFIEIAEDVLSSVHLLDPKKILHSDDVIFLPNEDGEKIITTKPKN